MICCVKRRAKNEKLRCRFATLDIQVPLLRDYISFSLCAFRFALLVNAYYPYGSCRFMFLKKLLETSVECLRCRFLFFDFFVRMWLLPACILFTLPLFVILNRLATHFLVFIFGICILLHCHCERSEAILFEIPRYARDKFDHQTYVHFVP